MTIRRISRERRITPEEAAKYKAVRQQIEEELPELISRHHERTLGDKTVSGSLEDSTRDDVQSSRTE